MYSDYLETQNTMYQRTDPLDADSDNDLLSDGLALRGWEVSIYGETP